MGCGCQTACGCSFVVGDGLSIQRIGDTFHLSLVIDPASTAPITLGPAGIRVDCCVTPGEEVAVLVPLGSQQIVVSAGVSTLVVPASTKTAIIENLTVSVGKIRYTYDGSTPVGGGLAGNGHYLNPGAVFTYDGDPTLMQFTADGASDATIDISYFDRV